MVVFIEERKHACANTLGFTHITHIKHACANACGDTYTHAQRHAQMHVTLTCIDFACIRQGSERLV